VEIIVANAAGGGNDIAARVLAEYLEKNLGQRFVVSNKDAAPPLSSG
jgi:tripartite-type tricarboxylate transporter receptor subunit TctC